MLLFRGVILAMALLMAGATIAKDVRTDWIEPVVGFQEKAIGARVDEVDTSDEGVTRMVIAIPKKKLKSTDQIQEVVVYSMKPAPSGGPKINISHEWATDFAGDYYGLILHIGENGNLPIRLYLKGLDNPN